MKIACKIIYWCGLAFIAIIIIMWMSIKLVPLDFQTDGYEQKFHGISLFGIPVAIILTATKAGFQNSISKNICNIILNRVLFSVLWFVFSTIYFTATWADGLCLWSTGRVIFEKKSNASIKLVERYFGCGAVDGTETKSQYFIQTSITPFFFYYTPADTAKIDRNIWVRAHL